MFMNMKVTITDLFEIMLDFFKPHYFSSVIDLCINNLIRGLVTFEMQ